MKGRFFLFLGFASPELSTKEVPASEEYISGFYVGSYCACYCWYSCFEICLNYGYFFCNLTLNFLSSSEKWDVAEHYVERGK